MRKWISASIIRVGQRADRRQPAHAPGRIRGTNLAGKLTDANSVISRAARMELPTLPTTPSSPAAPSWSRGFSREGFHPIVWCRYIATADYVAEGLQRALRHEFDKIRVVSITGLLSDDERRAKVTELTEERRRVLVATDCLSEGINLQSAFNAALHYDLPWNPNRLEQREGRVDRFGQTLSKTVKTIRYFSPDNPVDGVVIRVLLNKAREIHQALGTHVPVPEESETVTQAVLQALFFRGRTAEEALPQMELGLELPEVVALHQSWDLDAAREKENRTRFAQRALKPEEVRRELEATDAVLGDPEAVRLFVLNACQRLGIHIAPLAAKKPEERRQTGDRRQETRAAAVSPVSLLPSPASPSVLTPAPGCRQPSMRPCR